jgi:DNA modification methylase
LDNNSVDLIISHPPYLGQILYYNIYRLVNDLLGFSYDEVKKNDISTNSFKDYMSNMQRVFDEMYRVLKPKKYACTIIGDTRKEGGIVPTFSYFIDYANKIGFKLMDIFIWVLSRKAGMNVARRGNYVDHNYILVFQKRG